jgi:hypothetical protein
MKPKGKLTATRQIHRNENNNVPRTAQETLKDQPDLTGIFQTVS